MHYGCNTLENALEREDFWKQTCIALGTLRQKQKFSKDFNVMQLLHDMLTTLKWREKTEYSWRYWSKRPKN